MGKNKRFGCDLCDKAYTANHNLQKHKKSVHMQQIYGIPEKEKSQQQTAAAASPNKKQNQNQQTAAASCPDIKIENQNQQQQEQSMTTQPRGDDQSNETIFSLAENTYLRHYLQDIFILQKGEHSIRLHRQELFHIYNMAPAINDSICDFIEGKVIRFTQHLGEDIYLSVHTPYKSVDIRKFWIIPDTNQLHPTRIGIPLSFTEYYRFMEVLGRTVFNNAPRDTDLRQGH